MGLPARKHEPKHPQRRPSLRIVAPGERVPRTRGRRVASSSRAPHAAARQLYRIFVLCMVVVTAIGVGRVALTAAAAKTSLDSAKLRKEIKSARYEGDMLEVQQSAMTAPSRVKKLAGAKLSLAEPESVSYLGIDAHKKPASSAKPKAPAKKPKATSPKANNATRKPAPSGVSGLVSKVMDIAAGEASALMVGDVGLSSPK